MKTLLINAHPDYQNGQHYSMRLQDRFLENYRRAFPEQTVDVLNLYGTELPQLTTDQLLGIWRKQAAHVTLSPEETRIWGLNQRLLGQFKAHHRIVIVSPLHNFNVTARLKDYLDNILVARETFRYTETGSVGLMTDDYRVLLLQASGSVYTRNDRYTPMEFSRLYLQKMFQEIMGFDRFGIVRIEGTQTHGVDVSAAVHQGLVDLDAQFAQFYAD